MNAIKIRPNNDFLYTANWQEVYTLTKHWHSDIEFYAYEVNFLYTLIDKYFIWLEDDENVNRVEQLRKELRTMKITMTELNRAIQVHLKHINALLENAFIYDEHTFKDEHTILEKKLSNFANDYKTIKKQVFECTENILNSEKVEYLLRK